MGDEEKMSERCPFWEGNGEEGPGCSFFLAIVCSGSEYARDHCHHYWRTRAEAAERERDGWKEDAERLAELVQRQQDFRVRGYSTCVVFPPSIAEMTDALSFHKALTEKKGQINETNDGSAMA